MIELSRRLLLAGLLLAAAAPAQAGQALTAGAYPANPPWEFKAADGHFEGFEVDLVQAVAKRLGATVGFADTGFQALFAGTSSGRIDMAISSITITPDRLKSQAFTQPYYDSDGAVLTRAGSPIASISDLKGKTIGAIAASSGEAYAKAHAAELGLGELKSYNTQDNLMLDVRNGRIDGGLGEVAGFQYAMSKTPGLAIAVRIPTGERFAIMMKKGSPLLGPVNEAIAALKQDGTLAAIHQTWFGTPAPAGSSTITVLPLPRRRRSRTGGAAMELVDTFFNRDVFAQSLPILLRGLSTTLSLGAAAIVFGTAGGLALSLARLYARRPLRLIALLYIDLFRAVPVLVVLVLIYYALPFVGVTLSSFAAAALALSLVLAAFTAEVLRAGIESIPAGQSEAAQALGLTFWQALRKVVLPQAARVVIPPQTSNMVSIIKDTSLASVVALPDLLKQATDTEALFANPTPLIGAALIYVALLWPLVRLIAVLERRSRQVRTARQPT